MREWEIMIAVRHRGMQHFKCCEKISRRYNLYLCCKISVKNLLNTARKASLFVSSLFHSAKDYTIPQSF